jgi:mannosyltransferase
MKSNRQVFYKLPLKFLSEKSHYLYLAAILILAVFLRLYELDYKSLWLDELYSIVPTNPQNSIGFIVEYCKADQPPFYFLILHFWFQLFSYDSFYARLLSVIIGVLGVVAIYFLGKEIKNKEVGVFASFLTCINYFCIYYSQEARFYSLLFLFTVLSFIFFIKTLKHQNFINYFLYLVTTIGLIYTQYFGILIFGIQALIFLTYIILFRPSLRFILTATAVAIMVACSFTPWLPTLIYDSGISNYWIEKPKPFFFAVYYYLYWGKDIVVSLTLLALSVKYFITFYGLTKSKTQYTFDFFAGVILVLWIVLSYLIPYIRSLTSTPILIPRYTLVTMPGIFLVMALGFNSINNNKIKIWIIAVITLSSIVNLFFVRNHYRKIDKAQWREAAHAVINNYEPNVLVYSNLEWWYNFYFYFTDPHIKVTGTYSSNEELEQQPFIDLVMNREQLWVISGEGMNGLNNMQQAYVNEHFVIKEKHLFFAASAILYERKK